MISRIGNHELFSMNRLIQWNSGELKIDSEVDIPAFSKPCRSHQVIGNERTGKGFCDRDQLLKQLILIESCQFQDARNFRVFDEKWVCSKNIA